MKLVEVNDSVLFLGQFEGIVTEVKGDQVLIYCPEYDEEQPWIVTGIDNVVVLATRLIN